MNYYNPSFYPSYNGNIQMPPSQYYFNQQPQQVMNNPSANGLNGKLVDSEDMARVTYYCSMTKETGIDSHTQSTKS